MKKKIVSVLLAMTMAVGLMACGSQSDKTEKAEEKTETASSDSDATYDESHPTIKFGTQSNHAKVVDALVPALEEMGYKVDVKVFDDPNSINVATQDGSIDINLFEHKPYMENFNNSNNGTLEMVEPYLYAGVLGLFSAKYDSVDKIPDGAKIAIAQDGSNKDRDLRLMEQEGLLKLSDKPMEGDLYTQLDITENPKNLEFIEGDQYLYSLVNSLDDVDAATISCSFFVSAGKDLSQALAFSTDNDRFPLGLVVEKSNIDEKWVKDCADVFTTDDARKVIEDVFQGSYEVLFK